MGKQGQICPILRRIAGLCNEKADKNGLFLPLAQQISLKSDRLLDGQPIEPPRCPHCNHRIRPGSVLFGENLPKRVWEAAAQAMRRCDVCLIVGTSAEVYPAARLPLLAKRNRATLIQVNLEPNEFSHRVDFDLRGAAGVVLPELIQAAFPD